MGFKLDCNNPSISTRLFLAFFLFMLVNLNIFPLFYPTI
jgi:hypothetical protein